MYRNKIYDKIKQNREKEIIKTSIITIIANFILAGFKAFLGLISNSVAIISDAINNFSDALSSVITIVGTKLASKELDKKHPYGYGRIEYMSALIVSAIVVYAGATSLVESVKKIFNPEESSYTLITIIILIVGIIVKFVLGLYVKKKGKKVNSESLVASGSDAFNDGILSLAVLVSAIIFMIFKVNIEAYVSLILSIFIIKSGLEMIKEAVDDMLGTRVESKLSKEIKKEIVKNKDVQGAYDLILNNYGPDKYQGSVHIEVLDTLNATDIDRISREIFKDIYSKFNVIIHTVGIYSVNTKDENIISIRENIRKIIFSHDGILQMHGFYIDEKNKFINVDIIIDFKIKDRNKLYQKILNEIKNEYKGYRINLTLDVDVSD